eukprot:tig00000711_g3410.t1
MLGRAARVARGALADAHARVASKVARWPASARGGRQAVAPLPGQPLRRVTSSSAPTPPHAPPDRSQDAETIISIDRSGLIGVHGPHAPNPKKSAETKLARVLKQRIRMRGPISLADYMREAMTHPLYGYYMQRDVFGASGDFVTSPEISQVFGELVGVWAVALWQQIGCPKELHLIECGPGRGSMMADILRCARNFPDFRAAIRVHLVEASPALRRIQRANLTGGPPPAAPAGDVPEAATTPDGVPVTWHYELGTVPDGPTALVAQEFFDALPIYQFEHTERGWVERLIDVDDGAGPHHLRFVLSPGKSPAAAALLAPRAGRLPRPKRGERAWVEVCAEGEAVAEAIGRRVAEHGGGALIIDYGEDGPQSDSLRAIRRHGFVDALSEPGEADLSANVDFSALRAAAEAAAPGAAGYGPLTQRDFLLAMGLHARVEALLAAAADDAQREAIAAAANRLVDPAGMGSQYLVMAIASRAAGAPVPFPNTPPPAQQPPASSSPGPAAPASPLGPSPASKR